MRNWREAFKKLPSQLLFQGILAFICLLPLLATYGQYITSGFLGQKVSVLILFWPGVKGDFSVPLPVWLIMGAMAASYLLGIIYLLRNGNFGKVMLWGITIMVIANMIGGAVDYQLGWHELQNIGAPEIAGKVNRVIFSLWHNPLWEEIVFRGLPLLLVIYITKKRTGNNNWLKWSYFIIPSLLFALYHIPNHGPARFVDTFISGIGFAWLAFEYSFFASLILHYFFDAMFVIHLGKKDLPVGEINWLVNNSAWLNTAWNLAILAVIILIPVLILWQRFRPKKPSINI